MATNSEPTAMPSRYPQTGQHQGDIPCRVFESITRFFDERCGGSDDGQPLAREPGLLRTACVGNPERTIQGELFAYLKQRHAHVVLEYRLHSFTPHPTGVWPEGRSIDIMVLDDGFMPACAIELKHLGRMQGEVGALLDGLEEDWERFDGVGVPLILVGVYSDISSLPPGRTHKDFEAFRFISCYAFHKDGRPKKLKSDCNATHDIGHSWLEDWARQYCHSFVTSFRGAPEKFCTPAGPVTGRVHYFIGLTNDRRREPGADGATAE